MMKRSALLSLLVAGVSFATTMLAVDVPTLSRSAEVIVIGVVQTSNARLTADGRKVVTDTEIKVREVLKGSAPDSVILVQPGGVVAELGQRVEGTAPFTAGEEVLVFLERRGNERYAPTAMVQGKYRLERSTDGRTVTAVPESASAARLVDPATQQETTSPLKPVSLQILKAQIAQALAAPLPTEPTRPTLPKVGQ